MGDDSIRRRPAQLTFGFGVPPKDAASGVPGRDLPPLSNVAPRDSDLAETLMDLRVLLLRRGGIG